MHYARAHRRRRRSRYGNRRLRGCKSFRAFRAASALRLLLRRACRRKEELYRRALSHMLRPISRSGRHSLHAPAHGRLTDNIISEAAPFVKMRKTQESLSSSQTAGNISPPDSDQKRALCTLLHAGSLCSDILFGCRQNSRPKKLQICAYFAIISLGKRSGRTAERSNGPSSTLNLTCPARTWASSP